MPGHVYFRQAAANVRSGIGEIRQEIERKRKELSDREQEAKNKVQELNDDKNNKERMSGSSQIDNSQRVQLQKEAQEAINQIVDEEHRLGDDRAKLQQEIGDMERDMMSLEQIARGLESRQ